MNVQVKETIWRKIEIKDGVSKEDLIKFLKEYSPDAIFDEPDMYAGENELLIDTTTIMEETDFSNDGFSTIEVWDNDEIIWQNGHD